MNYNNTMHMDQQALKAIRQKGPHGTTGLAVNKNQMGSQKN
jgi:hypothetical protein